VKAKLFLTRKLPSPCIGLLQACCEIELARDDELLFKEGLIRGVKGKHGIIRVVSDDVDAELIRAGTDLRVISCYSVGYGHVDVAEST